MDKENDNVAPRSEELTSWKQIADYLGVHVRTAQKWERERRLPVKRLAGTRSRVTADPATLQEWMGAGTAVSITAESLFSWPLGPGVRVEVRFLGGPIRTEHLDLLIQYLGLVKVAWQSGHD